jgi:hypothetical protein
MQTTILGRLFQRLILWVATVLDWFARTPAARHVIKYGVIAVALLVIGHFILLAYAPGGTYAAHFARRMRPKTGGDPWALAKRLAARGLYTEAAHALYGALLDRVSARVPLRLDPSKTAGDYARDLRHTAPTVFGPFREFARGYEVVIYRLGVCDQPRFQSLMELAGRIDPELGSLG